MHHFYPTPVDRVTPCKARHSHDLAAYKYPVSGSSRKIHVLLLHRAAAPAQHSSVPRPHLPGYAYACRRNVAQQTCKKPRLQRSPFGQLANYTQKPGAFSVESQSYLVAGSAWSHDRWQTGESPHEPIPVFLTQTSLHMGSGFAKSRGLP